MMYRFLIFKLFWKDFHFFKSDQAKKHSDFFKIQFNIIFEVRDYSCVYCSDL